MSSCKRKQYICSAYQSAFYLDQHSPESEALKVYAAVPLGPDSTPIDISEVKKTKVLLISPTSRKKKEKAWKIIPMETVFPPVDSAMLARQDSLARSIEAASDSADNKYFKTDTTSDPMDKFDVDTRTKKATEDAVPLTKKEAKALKKLQKKKDKEAQKLKKQGLLPADPQPEEDPNATPLAQPANQDGGEGTVPNGEPNPNQSDIPKPVKKAKTEKPVPVEKPIEKPSKKEKKAPKDKPTPPTPAEKPAEKPAEDNGTGGF